MSSFPGSYLSSSPGNKYVPKKKKLGLKKYEVTTEYNFESLSIPDVDTHSEEKEWVEYLSNWDKFLRKAKYLVRQGIPPSVRGTFWIRITNSDQLLEKNKGVFQCLVDRQICDETNTMIKQDIRRTFPENIQFKTFNMQKSMYNVLKAYSTFDPDITYCQGMSFICAILVYHLPEEESFWVFVQMIKSYDLGGMFKPGLPLLTNFLYKLERLIKVLSPDLYLHLQNLGIKSVMYASEWFSTLFAYNFNFELTSRIWDVFLVEGLDYLLKIALALLKISEKHVLNLGFEETLIYLKERGYNTVIDNTIFKIADSLDTETVINHIEIKDP